MNETMAGVAYDSLRAGLEGMYRVRWLEMDSGTTIERGALLAGGWDGTSVKVHLATESDTTGSELFIAAKDKEENESALTAYSGGTFNRSALKVSEGADIKAFELELRRQGICLTEVI